MVNGQIINRCRLLICPVMALGLLIGGHRLSVVPRAYAAEDFSTVFRSTYEVLGGGQTRVTHQIELTNKKPNVFVSEYSVSVGGTQITNVGAFGDQGPLPISISRTQNSFTIVVNLEDQPVVGEGQVCRLRIQYLNADIATNIGQVLEVNIPRVDNANEFDGYEIMLVVPNEFGSQSSVVPEPLEIQETAAHRLVKFTKLEITSGITAVFGTRQTFSAEIVYFLRNDSSMAAEQSIALIPDTEKQRVVYRSIEPQPLTIDRDDDGNWLAVYRLDPDETLEVKAALSVELYLEDRLDLGKAEGDLDQYLSPTEFWPAADPEILELAARLKTPRSIYDYVVEHLEYDYAKIQEGSRRLGAKAVLANPDQAICTEFVDLFVTLARAAGIPSREHNGFAYTQNPVLRPLSLEKDVLHSWPDYWDQETNRWVQIDPTWADTTGGIDYFTKTDLNHITFVIHGVSATSPLPAGFYKTSADQGKTVLIKPAEIKFEDKGSYHFEAEIPKRIPTYRSSTVRIAARNLDGQAWYHLPLAITSPYNIDSQTAEEIRWLLPWQEVELQFKIRPRSFWVESRDRLTITLGDKTQVYETLTLPLFNQPQILAVAVGAGGVFFSLVAFAARRLYLRRRRGRDSLRRQVEES